MNIKSCLILAALFLTLTAWATPGAAIDVNPSINNGAQYTTTRNVTLYLNGATGATQMKFRNFDGVSLWTDWEPFAPTKAWTLSSGDGGKWVDVIVKDAAGNESPGLRGAGIILDTTPPTGTISIENGAPYATTRSVTLNLSGSDAHLYLMRFKNENSASWSGWYNYAATRSWTLSDGDGLKTVSVQFRDRAGNISTATISDTITLDTAEPTNCSVTINNGASYATSRNVTLTPAASGASHMRFSNDGSDWSDGWWAYNTSKSWTLASGDGLKTVHAQFKDAAGNIANTVSDNINLDSTAPTNCSISVNGGAAATNTTAVTLTLAATGASQMCFVNESGSWSKWESYTASKSWTLTGGDGLKTVNAQFKDAAGNITTVSDTIQLDATAPTNCSISINNGAAYATQTGVTLTLAASSASSMRFSNNNSTWSGWQAYGTSKSWTLASGDGVKTVYAQFRDAAGNTAATVSDAITLDASAPAGTLVINDAAAFTNSTTVSLDLTVSEDTTQMRFMNSGGAWSVWEPWNSVKAWTLASGDGLKTVFAQLKDAAGNTSTGTINNSITLDTTAPSGSVTINNGAAYTNDRSVTLSLAATDGGSGMDQMAFSNDGVGFISPEPFAATKGWTITAGEGAKTVYVRFYDKLGNVSTATANITLDTTAPTGSLVINNGAAYANNSAVTLALNAAGASLMRFRNEDTGSWSNWEAYAATKSWTLSSGSGVKTVYAQFRDEACNWHDQ